MNKLEEIKAATAALNPEDQMELFNWWVQTETFQTRQLAALKRALPRGWKAWTRGATELTRIRT